MIDGVRADNRIIARVRKTLADAESMPVAGKVTRVSGIIV